MSDQENDPTSDPELEVSPETVGDLDPAEGDGDTVKGGRAYTMGPGCQER